MIIRFCLIFLFGRCNINNINNSNNNSNDTKIEELNKKIIESDVKINRLEEELKNNRIMNDRVNKMLDLLEKQNSKNELVKSIEDNNINLEIN